MARERKFEIKLTTWVTPKVAKLLKKEARARSITTSELLRHATELLLSPPMFKITIDDAFKVQVQEQLKQMRMDPNYVARQEIAELNKTNDAKQGPL